MENDLKKRIDSLTTPKKVTSYTTFLILLSITGVFQFLTLGCDFSALLTSTFYLTLGYRVCLIYLAYDSGINFTFDKSVQNPLIIDAYDKLKELKKLIDNNFQEFLNILNEKRKRIAWNDKINHEIAKLERKIDKTKSIKKKEALTEEIKKKKEKLTLEYFEEHKDFINVKYYRILESDFIVMDDFATGDSTDKTRVDFLELKTKSIFKKIAPFLLISLVFGVTATSALNRPVIETVISLLYDLMLIAMRLSQGMFDCPKIVDSSYLIPYNNRINIIKDYIEWNKDNESSKSSKIIKFIEENKATNGE